MKNYVSFRANRLSVVTLSVLSLGGVSEPAFAQPTLPIIVSATQNLNFGTFFTVGSSGTLTINSVGTRSTTGGVTAFAGAGLETQGQLSITASTGVIMTIEFVPNNFTVANGTGATMLINNITIDGGGDSVTRTLTQSPSIIPFGARLNVTSPQAQGTYTGTFSFSAVYQ